MLTSVCVCVAGARQRRERQAAFRALPAGLPHTSCVGVPRALQPALPAALRGQGSRVSWCPYLPPRLSECQGRSERHQLAVTLPAPPQTELLGGTAGVREGPPPQMHGLGFVNTGLLHSGGGPGPRRAPTWHLLATADVLRGFKTLLILYTVGGLFQHGSSSGEEVGDRP